MGIGFLEALLIIVIALVFFGGKKLPQLGKSLGESIRSFKEGMNETDDKNKKNDKNS